MKTSTFFKYIFFIFWQVVLKPSVPNHHKDLYNGGVDATTPSNIETLNASLLSHQDDHELEQHAKVDKKELTDVTDTASSSPGMYHSQCCNGFENVVRWKCNDNWAFSWRWEISPNFCYNAYDYSIISADYDFILCGIVV